MEIHNLLEELAVQTVQEICREDEARPDRRYGTSPEIQVDAVCYVLNRIQPRYVSSGRGYTHLMEQLYEDQQLQIDLVRLAHEGLKRVNAVTRAFYGKPSGEIPAGPCFNFPTIKGRVLDGNGFFPLSEVTVTLRHAGETAPMFDNRWNNPYMISDHTRGMFTFWPAPVPSKEAGTERPFEFEILVERDGFSPLTHYFTLDVTSEQTAKDTVSLQRDHRLPDLYLF